MLVSLFFFFPTKISLEWIFCLSHLVLIRMFGLSQTHSELKTSKSEILKRAFHINLLLLMYSKVHLTTRHWSVHFKIFILRIKINFLTSWNDKVLLSVYLMISIYLVFNCVPGYRSAAACFFRMGRLLLFLVIWANGCTKISNLAV